MIITGAILVSVSVIGGIFGSVLTVGQFDGAEFNDVVIDGATNPAVPGKLSFRVAEPLQQNGPVEDVRVGVAVDYASLPVPDCTMQDTEGEAITLSAPAAEEQLLNDDTGNLKVLGSAPLQPGDYEAICTVAGEPSGSEATFTVGRVFGFSDLRGVFAPILWFLAVGAIATVIFIVGLILLIVGLVRRSKGRKQPPPQFPGGPGQFGGPGGYGGPGQFGGSGQPGPYAQPGPYGQAVQPGQPQQFGPPGASGQPGPSGQPAPYGQPGQYPPAVPPPATPPPWPGPHAPGSPEGQAPPAPPSPPTGPVGPTPDGSSEQAPSGWTIPPSKR